MVQHRLPMLPSAGEVSWVASVNGVNKQLNIENNAILLDVLRDQAALETFDRLLKSPSYRELTVPPLDLKGVQEAVMVRSLKHLSS